MRLVDKELNFAPQPNSEREQKVPSLLLLPLTSSRQLFLCVRSKRVVGALMAESVSTARRVRSSSSLKSQSDGGSSISLTEQPVPVEAGISRLWVHKQHRRQGIATRLVEAMRLHFHFGLVLPKERLAMSQSSGDGHDFARAYWAGSYLIYV